MTVKLTSLHWLYHSSLSLRWEHFFRCCLSKSVVWILHNSPSSRSLANPGSAPVERTKSDRTASISTVMWSWIHKLAGCVQTEKKGNEKRKNTKSRLCSPWQDSKGKGWGAPVLYRVLLYQPHLKGEQRLNYNNPAGTNSPALRHFQENIQWTVYKSLKEYLNLFTSVKERQNNEPAQHLFKCKSVVAWLLLNLTPFESFDLPTKQWWQTK